MFKLLYSSSTSTCFELLNELVYYSGTPYYVTVNGERYGSEQKTNVFSIFGLKPATLYTIGTTLDSFTLQVKTRNESCVFNVKDFGAAGDGKTIDTSALQTAINACPRNGRILVEGGVFYTAPLVLKSNMTLEIARGAKLLASTDPSDYPLWPGEVNGGKKKPQQCSSWEGLPQQCYQSFISAYHADNVTIIGEGEIDGNGQNGIWYVNHKAQKIGRPRLVFLNGCRNFTVHGITGENSASWNFHPFFSKNVNFYDIRVNAEKDSPNTDGCNPESCDGVNIIGAVFSVGDDCIAIKSGKRYMGEKYKTPCSNLTIRNCLMQFGHGGVVLGSEMSGGINNLDVSRCVFSHTDRGLRIKTRRGRGKYAVIDNVSFSNIVMDNVLSPLVINMFYFCDPDGKTEYVWSKQKLPVDDGTPYLGSFHFKDMVCNDVEQAAGFFYGLPEQPVKEVFIENVNFSVKADAKPGMPAMMSFAEVYCKAGLYFNNVQTVKLKNVTFKGIEGEEITAHNVGNIIREN